MDIILMPETKVPPRFDWAIYADATFAGLAALIPLPLVDLYFEWLFRRRMVRAIAYRNGRLLNTPTINEINRDRSGQLQGCLLWPLKLVYSFLKRLSRKIFYFLAIKEAVDNLNYYWHRAFLLDYMLRAGYLDHSREEVVQAVQTLDLVLKQTDESPLLQLARQVVGGVRHVLRSLWRWRRHGEEDAAVIVAKEQMSRRWHDFNAYFQELILLYNETHVALHAATSSNRHL
jgi:hypothetical protein